MLAQVLASSDATPQSSGHHSAAFCIHQLIYSSTFSSLIRLLRTSPVFPSMVYLKWKSFHSTWRIHFLCLLIIAIHSSIILTTFCFVLFHVTPPVFSFLPSHIWSMFLIHEALHSLPVILFALVVFVSFPLHYETPSCLLLFFAIPHMSCCILHDYTSLTAEFLSLFQLLPINAYCTCCFLSFTYVSLPDLYSIYIYIYIV